jgi:hypothetical protein
MARRPLSRGGTFSVTTTGMACGVVGRTHWLRWPASPRLSGLGMAGARIRAAPRQGNLAGSQHLFDGRDDAFQQLALRKIPAGQAHRALGFRRALEAMRKAAAPRCRI